MELFICIFQEDDAPPAAKKPKKVLTEKVGNTETPDVDDDVEDQEIGVKHKPVKISIEHCTS